MILASCKKEHAKDTTPVQSLHKVAFKVGFSQQTSAYLTNSLNSHNLSLTRLNTNAVDTSLTDNHVSTICYAVYDSLGNNVHNITQLSTDANFGILTDNLRAGNYTVILAAGQTGLSIGLDPANTTTTTSKISTDIVSYGDEYPIDLPGKDIFYKKLSLTVTNTDASQSVNLDRITSRLTVDIEDAIPANAKYIVLTFIGAPAFKYYVGTSTAGAGNTTTFSVIDTITVAKIGTTNNKLTTILLSPPSAFSVNLMCGTGIGSPPGITVIAQKTIPNVTCQPNTQTILTGNLFGGAGAPVTGGFSLTIDTSWNSTPITKSFP